MPLLGVLPSALFALSLAFHVLALPALQYFSQDAIRPLVIWHGMGDSYGSPGILQFIQLIKDMHPGLYVHSVFLDTDLKEDQKAGFFGNVSEQVLRVSEQLANITELQGGFDAIGFSQGGQFLRAYVERYNAPPVHNLITFGSQHMGISDLPVCGRLDLSCQLARRAAQRGVYTDWAQKNLVQAQYFRDPAQLQRYIEHNKFLPSINNEIPALANSTYAEHLASLNKLVLVIFSADETVVPKETSWFGSYAMPDGGDAHGEKTIVPMRLQPLYTEDWIGLRTLDERGDVAFATCEGQHMQLTNECWQPLVVKYVGGTMDTGQDKTRDVLVVQ